MPNWTINLLTITGEPDKITDCLEAINGDWPDCEGNQQIICFQKILPLPATIEAGSKSEYDWCISNWGCKWNADRTNLEGSAESGEVYIRFETPWGPPTPILHALRDQYPELEFSLRYRLEDDPEYPHDADEAI